MKKLLLLAMVMLFTVGQWVLPPSLMSESNACWIFITTDELIEKSDVILIGNIMGKVGEEKSPGGVWSTFWKVKVHYYLKGNRQTEEIIVTTPGAVNKSPQTSIDYSLNLHGSAVLLFLREGEGTFQPLSPQGVVGLEVNSEYSPELGGAINGKALLKKYGIAKSQLTDQSRLEEYILENESIYRPETTEDAFAVPEQGTTENVTFKSGQDSAEGELSTRTAYSNIITGMGFATVCGMGILFMKKRFPK